MEINLKKAVETLCLDIDETEREDFFSRMDPEYFSLFSPAEIAGHLRITAGLSPEHPVLSKMSRSEGNLWNIVITAYDYFSEFSMICGLFTSYGLDIVSGHSFTFSESAPGLPPVPRKSGRKKILDLFQVRPLNGKKFDRDFQEKFQQDLETLVVLLDQNQIAAARGEVNRRVVEYLSGTKTPFMSRLYPVNIQFNNHFSEKWTVMEIRSRNTPAFLYAFSNALSMQNIYIYKVRIESRGERVLDRIFINNSRGNKIKGKKEQELLKMTTVLTKQFTHFLTLAPNPAKGIQYFDQLLEKVLEKGGSPSLISFLYQKSTLDLLARLLGTSEFLWEDFLKMRFEDLLPILKSFKKKTAPAKKKELRLKLKKALARGKTFEDKKKILNEFKDCEMFRIDLNHLLKPKRDLMAFSLALTELAEAVLEEVCILCSIRLMEEYGKPFLSPKVPCPFAICGLGKFGGREMGYASDIELLFVYGGEGKTGGERSITTQEYFERLGQDILNTIEAKREGIFHVDLRLRPYGAKGSISSSLAYLKSYYAPGGGAAPFERQALTRLRRVAGDPKLGRAVEEIRDQFTYSREPWDIRAARNLRRRQAKELVKPGDINIKYSPGGVIDLEYTVQYYQVLQGWRFPEIRSSSTVEALKGLYQKKILSKEECNQFGQAYLFLRTLIDALRVVRGNARDLILPDRKSEEFKFLARRMGYIGTDWKTGARELHSAIRRQMQFSRQFFTRHFGKI